MADVQLQNSQKVAQTAANAQAVPNIAVRGKQVFSADKDAKQPDTPVWLKEAGEAAQGKIVAPVGIPSQDIAGPIKHFREQKPSPTDLGINPASNISVNP